MSNKRALQIATKELNKAKAPSQPKDIIYDPAGQWKFPGQNTRIPGGDITMQGVPYPVYGEPNIGEPQMMYPGQDYAFPGADYVDEYPQMRRGGIPKYLKLPKNYGRRQYSNNISATNRLFAKNFLFRKERNKIYDPNAKYAKGGEQGCPEGYAFNPKTGECIEWNPDIRESYDQPTSFDPVGDVIYMNPDDRPEGMSDEEYAQMYQDQLEHEQLHRLQWKNDELKGESKTPLRMPSTVDNEDFGGDHYYNRRGEEVNYLHDYWKNHHPDEAAFIPDDVIYNYETDPAMYQLPWTVEGEARGYEYATHDGMESLFPKRAYGGVPQYAPGGSAVCPPGSYWNGKACVKLPKGAKVITNPKEYAKRKAAYEDSLKLYNFYYDRVNEAIKHGGKVKISKDPKHLKWIKDYNDFHDERNIKADRFYDISYPPGTKDKSYTGTIAYPKPKQPVAFKRVDEPEKKKEEPVKEKIVIDKLPIKQAVIDQPKKDIILPPKIAIESKSEYTPEYIEPGIADTEVGMEWINKPERYIDWNGRAVGYNLPRFRKPGHSGPLLKKGKRRYLHLPTIERRTEAWLEPNEDIQEEYKKGGQYTSENIIFSPVKGGCPDGQYWTGTECKVIPKGTKIVYNQEELNKLNISKKEQQKLYNEYILREKNKELINSAIKKKFNTTGNKETFYKSISDIPLLGFKPYISYGSSSLIKNGLQPGIPSMKENMLDINTFKKMLSKSSIKPIGYKGHPRSGHFYPVYEKPSNYILGYNREEKKLEEPIIVPPPPPVPPPVKIQEPIPTPIVVEKTKPQYESEYTPESIEPGSPDSELGAEWINKPERYIDWQGTSIGYRLPRFRKPGHSGPLIKKGKKRYIHLPTIEKRNTAYIEKEEEYQDGGYIETELNDNEIQAYRDGGYIVEDISIPSLNQKQDGGENDFYKVKGSKGVYRKVNGKWEVDWDKTGNFQPLSKGDVKKRSEQLNKNAELLFDPNYSDLISSQKAEYKPAPKAEPKKKVTPGQSAAQKVFAKDFKVSGKDRLGKAEDKIEKGVADYIKYHNENFDRPLTQQDIDNARETISNNIMASEGVYDPSAGEFNTNRKTISNADAKNFVAFNEKPKNLTAGDYLEKGWDIVSNPLDYANYFLKPKGTVNTPWNMHEYEKRLEKVGAEDPVTNNAVSEGLDFASWFLPAGMVAQGIKMIPDTAESIGTAIEDPTLSNIGKAAFDTGMTAISVMPGFKYAKEGAKYLTEATPLRNAYKYNPWAFKPNSESAYRMIGGKEGYLDALESGVLRPHQSGRYDATFYNVGEPLDRYRAGLDPQYMVEVPLSNKKIYPRFAGDDYRISEEIGAEVFGERIPQGHVGIKDPGVKIYKENWLRGYKPVDVPKQLPRSTANSNLKTLNQIGEEVSGAKNLLSPEQIEEGYSIVKDPKSNRFFVKKNNKEVGQIELFRNPTVDTQGNKWGSINIEIDPKHRGKGLSKPMYDAILAQAEAEGLSGIRSVDELLQSPEKSKALRKYYPGEYSKDENILKDVNKIIEEDNEFAREMGDTDFTPTAEKVYLIKSPQKSTQNIKLPKPPKLPKKLEDAIRGSESVVMEGLGELLKGKENRKAIQEGNAWLRDWIKHPTTQSKINRDMYKRAEFLSNWLADYRKANPNTPIDNSLINDLAVVYNQSQGFEPHAKEYNLFQQFLDNAGQYLGKEKKPIHIDNIGVSYTHLKSPKYRKDVQLGNITPNERYGSWISRSPFVSSKERIGTTIHEGTHDWTSSQALVDSGLRNISLKNTDPEIKKIYLEYEKLINLGKDPKAILGKDKAYLGYLAEPTEVHARLMELRYQFGLKPNTVINEDIAKKIIKAVQDNKTTVNPKFVKVFGSDPKKLTELLNRFWVTLPAAVGVGALQQEKDGGVVSELSQKEINDLTAQGYIVEDID